MKHSVFTTDQLPYHKGAYIIYIFVILLQGNVVLEDNVVSKMYMCTPRTGNSFIGLTVKNMAHVNYSNVYVQNIVERKDRIR